MSNLGNREIMSKNIKYYMDKNNKDRNQVCKDLGFKYSTFTDWVNGNKYPRIDKIELMANYFGITKSDLVEEKNNYTESNLKDQKDSDDLNNLPHNIRAAARNMANLSQEDQNLAINMINFLSKKGEEAKNNENS